MAKNSASTKGPVKVTRGGAMLRRARDAAKDTVKQTWKPALIGAGIGAAKGATKEGFRKNYRIQKDADNVEKATYYRMRDNGASKEEAAKAAKKKAGSFKRKEKLKAILRNAGGEAAGGAIVGAATPFVKHHVLDNLPNSTPTNEWEMGYQKKNGGSSSPTSKNSARVLHVTTQQSIFSPPRSNRPRKPEKTASETLDEMVKEAGVTGAIFGGVGALAGLAKHAPALTKAVGGASGVMNKVKAGAGALRGLGVKPLKSAAIRGAGGWMAGNAVDALGNVAQKYTNQAQGLE